MERRKLMPPVRLRQNWFFSGRMATLAVLIILILGFANLAFAPASWISPQHERPLEQIIRPLVSTPALPPVVVSQPIATPAPQPGIEHVVIITIDGLRPDALELADTPTMDSLMTIGTYCADAQTVSISRTLPGHASMLTGMVPEKHGIVWGKPYIGWPGMNGPSLFTEARASCLSTAMVYGKKKLDSLVLPDSVDILFAEDAHDPEIKDQAVKIIQGGLPNVLFVHFPDTDRVGHEFNWMSRHQLGAISFADGMIGEIVDALASGDYMDKTLLIVTSDHGGHENRHGDDHPLDRTIPWLAVGPGVPQGQYRGRPIRTYDTAPTVLYALKVPIPEVWDGQPLLDIFE